MQFVRSLSCHPNCGASGPSVRCADCDGNAKSASVAIGETIDLAHWAMVLSWHRGGPPAARRGPPPFVGFPCVQHAPCTSLCFSHTRHGHENVCLSAVWRRLFPLWRWKQVSSRLAKPMRAGPTISGFCNSANSRCGGLECWNHVNGDDPSSACGLNTRSSFSMTFPRYMYHSTVPKTTPRKTSQVAFLIAIITLPPVGSWAGLHGISHPHLDCCAPRDEFAMPSCGSR
jgi:hypothetical protein